MKILVIGNGGREHAIVYKCLESKYKPTVYAIKGNAGMNGAICVDIDEMNNDEIVAFVKQEGIDLTIVGPEAVLNNGIVDVFQKNKLTIFGPSKDAAIIETSKKYAKWLMRKYDIPTAEYDTFSTHDECIKYIEQRGFPIVIKFDGLAAGKGVSIVNNIAEAETFLNEIFNEKKYGTGDVVIEDFLEGPEFSLMAFVSGDKVYPMEIAQDHKRAYDNDTGPNTGGMGAYSPVPIISKADIDYAVSNIMEKTASALKKENREFFGILYGGLIKTKDGVKVIEFNARFGDPETEVVLPRLANDFIDVLNAVINKEDIILKWHDDVVLGVVMASLGYPDKYEKGHVIENIDDTDIYHMGTKLKDGRIVTNGGRVLMILGRGKTFIEARNDAYKKVEKIKCANLFYRKDIGHQIK